MLLNDYCMTIRHSEIGSIPYSSYPKKRNSTKLPKFTSLKNTKEVYKWNENRKSIFRKPWNMQGMNWKLKWYSWSSRISNATIRTRTKLILNLKKELMLAKELLNIGHVISCKLLFHPLISHYFLGRNRM